MPADQDRDTVTGATSIKRDDLAADNSGPRSRAECLKIGNRENHAGRTSPAQLQHDQQKKVTPSRGRAQRVNLAKGSSPGGNVLCSTSRRTISTSIHCRRRVGLRLPAAHVVSSQIAVLDRIATHVLALEGDSEVRWFEGNFTDYEAGDKSSASRRPAATPHKYSGRRVTAPVIDWQGNWSRVAPPDEPTSS